MSLASGTSLFDWMLLKLISEMQLVVQSKDKGRKNHSLRRVDLLSHRLKTKWSESVQNLSSGKF